MIAKVSIVMRLASLAMAMPATYEPGSPGGSVKRQDDEWRDIVDPWGQYGSLPVLESDSEEDLVNITARDVNIGGHSHDLDDLLEHAKRATVADYQNWIPGCDDDPSNADTPIPQWPINHGVKIPRFGDEDQCTTGKTNAQHCWTEYYLVEYAIEYLNWQNTGTVLQCDDTKGATCGFTLNNLKQTCAINGKVTTTGWDQKMVDVAASLAVGKDSWPVKPGVTVSHSYTKSGSVSENNLLNRCAAVTEGIIFTWALPDPITEENKHELCHQVWYADRVQHIWGQAQRVCNKCARSDQNVQQNTPDNGKCVRGQKEFEMTIPINKLVSAQGECNDAESSMPMPKNTERRLYQPPSDWKTVLISPALSPGPEDDGREVFTGSF